MIRKLNLQVDLEDDPKGQCNFTNSELGPRRKFVQFFSLIYSAILEQGAVNCSKIILANLTSKMTSEVNEISYGPSHNPEENMGPVSAQSFQPFLKKFVSLFRNSFCIVDTF